MNLQLENKLVLVNGSTAGIGSAIDKALAAEGGRVTVTKRIWQGQESQRRTSIKLGIHSPGIRQLT